MEKKCVCSTLDACQHCGVVFMPSLLQIYFKDNERILYCPVCNKAIEIPNKE